MSKWILIHIKIRLSSYIGLCACMKFEERGSHHLWLTRLYTATSGCCRIASKVCPQPVLAALNMFTSGRESL